MSTVMKSDAVPQATHIAWVRTYQELRTHYDPEYGALSFLMNPAPRPCFTPSLLRDIERFQDTVRSAVQRELNGTSEPSVKYLVLGSAVPGIFNLGGDLDFFVRTIRARDRATLTQYAQLSIKVLYDNLRNLSLPITTIALLEGTTLGAGFEAALSCDIIIADKNAEIGFPEVVFNMFPGMGAYSFLARRISPVMVERMIMSGRLYSAEELYEMGVIDILADGRTAQEELQHFLRKADKTRTTRTALLRMRERIHPITYEELLDIANLWVESALSLPDKDLRMMERLVRAQNRRTLPGPAEPQGSQAY
jgi:DSF synthase